MGEGTDPNQERWRVSFSHQDPVSISDLEGLSIGELREAIAAHSREEEADRDLWADVWRSHPEGLPFSIQARVGRSPEGRLVCTGLRLGEGRRVSPHEDGTEAEITQRGLRQVRLTEILAAIAGVDPYPGSQPEWEGKAVLDAFFVNADAEPVQPKPRVRPGREGYTREFFEGQELPRFYEHALKTSPNRPASQVARDLHVSEPTAYRWIRRAKKLGLLQDPPAD